MLPIPPLLSGFLKGKIPEQASNLQYVLVQSEAALPVCAPGNDALICLIVVGPKAKVPGRN